MKAVTGRVRRALALLVSWVPPRPARRLSYLTRNGSRVALAHATAAAWVIACGIGVFASVAWLVVSPNAIAAGAVQASLTGWIIGTMLWLFAIPFGAADEPQAVIGGAR